MAMYTELESYSNKPFFKRHKWKKLGNLNINWISTDVKELDVKFFLGVIVVL